MVLYPNRTRRRWFIAGAIVIVALVVTLELYVQFREVAACSAGGLQREFCLQEHTNLLRVLAMGMIALVLVSPALVPDSVQRAMNRLVRRIIRPPDDYERRRKLEIAGHIYVPSSIVASMSLILWIVAQDASKESLAAVFFILFIVSAALFISGIIFSVLTARDGNRFD